MTTIYLTGYRCTGKTTVGRLLAKKIHWAFVDADAMLVDEAKMTVAEIVEKYGWDDFRNRESDILKRLSQGKDQVVATGGGVILREKNRQIMNETGTVVWLKASMATISERMAGDEKTDGQRPGLTDKGALAEIEETLTQRLPIYKEAMDFSVETDGKSVVEIRDEILSQIGM